MRNGIAQANAEDHGREDEWREEAVAPTQRAEELCAQAGIVSCAGGSFSRGKDARIALIVPWVVAGGAAGSQFGRSPEVKWDEALDEEGGFADVSACELDIGVVECLVCAV